jgi:hypothetical protein
MLTEKQKIVMDYLKDHPDTPHTQFIKDTGVSISDAMYYMIRRNFRKGNISDAPEDTKGNLLSGVLVQKKNREKYMVLATYLHSHRNSTYNEVVKETSIQIDMSSWSRLKRKLLKAWRNQERLNGKKKIQPPKTKGAEALKVKRPYVFKRKRNPLYMRIFSIPTPSQEAKDILKAFIESLRDSKVANYEMVEYLDPKEIEIRDVKI